MASRKGTKISRTASKRMSTSKADIGAALADAVGFGSNGRPATAAARASIRAQIEFRAFEIIPARGGSHGDGSVRLVQGGRELNGY